MKHTLLPLLLWTVVLATVSCVSESDSQGDVVAVGDMLPAFSVTDNGGQTVTPASLRDSVAVLVFFQTSCSDCRRELPAIDAVRREFLQGGEAVRFLCISRAETAPTIADFWQQENLSLPYSAQETADVYRLFAERIIPRVYVADKHGHIRYSYAESVDSISLKENIRYLLKNN